MSTKRKAPTVEVSTISEVIEFVDARDALEEFKQEHAPVFEQLRELTERYNASLEAADKACRQREVSCGPFDLYQFTTKYDYEALYNAVGRNVFLELGGKIGTQTVYGGDPKLLEAAVTTKKLDPEVLKQVRKETPNFHKPEKLVVP